MSSATACLAPGTGTGVGGGLLFAPASGQETRRAPLREVFSNNIRKRFFCERARAGANNG